TPPMTDVNVHDYVESYEFRGESDYTPNDREKALIEDAIEGYRAMLSARPAAPSREAVAAELIRGRYRDPENGARAVSRARSHCTNIWREAEHTADAILALFAAQPGEAKAVAVKPLIWDRDSTPGQHRAR